MTRIEHRIARAELVTRSISEVDGRRMREEWQGGGLIFHDVEREVYEITCTCGEQGAAFTFEDIPPVFAKHLELVAT